MSQPIVADNETSGIFSRTMISPLTFEQQSNIAIESTLSEKYTIRKDEREDYIKFGTCNNHPQMLKELGLKSHTHKSILTGKQALCAGDGFIYSGDDEKKIEEINTWVKKALDPLREKLAWDLVLQGGICVGLKYKPDVSKKSGRDLTRLHKHDFPEMRLGTPRKLDSGIFTPRKAYIYPNWTKGTRYNSKGVVSIPLWFAYDNDEEKQEMQNGNLVYYDRVYSPFSKFYPVPDYQSESCLNAILIDSEVILFDVKELENNLSTGYIVTFYRKNYQDEDADRERELRSSEEAFVRNDMRGAVNNKNVLIQRAEPAKDGEVQPKVDIQEVPNNNDSDRHKIIDSRKNAAIHTGHGIPDRRIVGAPQEDKSGFSSDADQMKTAVDILFFTRLNKMRTVIQKFFDEMVKERFGEDSFTGSKFIDDIPFRQKISDSMYRWAYTENEFRLSKGDTEMDEDTLEDVRENRGAITDKADETNTTNN